MKLREVQEQRKSTTTSSTQPEKYLNEDNLSSGIPEDPNVETTCSWQTLTTKQAEIQIEVLVSFY